MILKKTVISIFYFCVFCWWWTLPAWAQASDYAWHHYTLNPPSGVTQFHVTPQGSPSGDGSIYKPWDLKTALSQSSKVKPGDIIWVHEGTHRGPIQSTLVGSNTKPIIVRQALGERALLDNGTNTDGTLEIKGAHTWFWGFEITNSNPTHTFDSTGRLRRATGPYVHGSHTKLINLVIHDTGMGVGNWSEAPNSEVYGNLIYYNGYENRDHGIYAQNKTGSKLISDNVVFYNASYGMHVYGSDAASLDNFHFEGNIVFNNGALYRGDWGGNFIVGGGKVALNPYLESNYTYYPFGDSDGANTIGYSSGFTNAVMKNNYFAGGDHALRLGPGVVSEMIGNTYIGSLQGFTSSRYPNNTYITTRPSEVKSFVRVNKYESNRLHIVVYNWPKQASVEVAIQNTSLTRGDLYEIRDALNYSGNPVTTGQFNGTSVVIPMTGLKIIQPARKVAYQPVHPAPEFGVFVLTKTIKNSTMGGVPTPVLTAPVPVAQLPICKGDVDKNDRIDAQDLLYLLGAWGSTSKIENIAGSNEIDVYDLMAILASWGNCS